MKLHLVLLAFISACSPTDPFVSFSPYVNEDGGGSPIAPVEVDSGMSQDTGAGGASAVEDGGIPETGDRDGSDAHTPAASGGSKTDAASAKTDAARSCSFIQIVNHWNGTGQTWRDCVPLNTYDEAQAMKACIAYAGNPTKCKLAPGCGTASQVVQGDGYLWGYEGNTAGYVGSNGSCPNAAGQPWG